MKKIVCLAVVLLAAVALAESPKPQSTPFESGADPTPKGKIDELVFARLKEAGIQPAALCSDEVFLRRVYLDVIGTLPTPAEARDFLKSQDPDKRAKLIDQLLERDEYADYWAMRWGDLLRVKSEFPINLWPNAVQAYHRWIRTALKENLSYDRFVRELLTTSGSNFRVPQVNFYRAVQGREPASLAKAVALAFMGDRMNSWPQDRKTGMAAFFGRLGYKGTAEWKEEIIFFDVGRRGPDSARLPDGSLAKLPVDRDPREVFADWLVTADNPWFARCAVNRIWFWLMGRGIIDEPDDIRPDNLPTHPKVLTFLEKEFVAAKYDVKHVYRLILNSNTYQLSSIPRSRDPRAESWFACYSQRRLDAEVLIDALCQITDTTEEYSSSIPEPFTWIPSDKRSTALPDGSITSSFLEMFGRPPRDTGMAAERNNAPTADQVLHLLNSSHVRKKIESSGKFRQLRQTAAREPDKALTELYLMILSRTPTPEELAVIKKYVETSRSQRGFDMVNDVAWALINSPEFLYRH